MPGPTRYAQGNVILEMVLGQTWTVPGIASNSETTTSYTVQGVQPNDFLELNQETHVTSIAIGNVWVIGTNSVGVQFMNPTTVTSATNTSINFLMTVTRYENAAGGFAAFPTAIE